MKNYSYSVENHSILTTWFIRVFVIPVSKLIPDALPANFISILSHMAVYLAGYISWREGFEGQVILVACLIFIHLLGDKLDGIHARKSGTASASGEFIDHFFEVFNRGIMIYIIFSLFQVNHHWLIVAVLAVIVLSLTMNYYKQYKTGLLVIDKAGAVELKVVMILLLLMLYFKPVYMFLDEPVYFGYSIIEGLLLLVFLSGILYATGFSVRMGQMSYAFWLYIFLFIVVTVLTILIYGPLRSGVVVLLYGGLYAGRIMISQLVDGFERSPGFFTPIFLLIHYVTTYFTGDTTFFIILLYLVTMILLVVVKVFRALAS